MHIFSSLTSIFPAAAVKSLTVVVALTSAQLHTQNPDQYNSPPGRPALLMLNSLPSRSNSQLYFPGWRSGMAWLAIMTACFVVLYVLH